MDTEKEGEPKRQNRDKLTASKGTNRRPVKEGFRNTLGRYWGGLAANENHLQ